MSEEYTEALDAEIAYYKALAAKQPATGTGLRLKRQLLWWTTCLEQAKEAFIGLLDGRAQKYTIGSRSLERLDLKDLFDIIGEIEDELEDLESEISGSGGRQVIPIIPMNW